MKCNIVSAFLLLILQATVLAAPTTAPSVAELQADYDSQKYAEVVRKAPLALQAKPDPSAPLDRVKVLELQAESQVQLKRYAAAADAFVAAAKASGNDASAAANYRANSVLLRKVNGAGKYVPKPPADRGTRAAGAPAAKIEAIDVIDPISRKQAMNALLTDETAVATAKLVQLKQQPLIDGIKSGFNTIEPLRDLEQAASGTDSGYRKMLGTLADQSAESMKAELEKMDVAVNNIFKLANQDRSIAESVDQNGLRQFLAQKRGLGPNESAVLNEVARNCKEFAGISESLGNALGVSTEAPARGSRRGRGTTATLASIKDDATKLEKRVNDMLSADYTSVPVQPSSGRRARPPGN